MTASDLYLLRIRIVNRLTCNRLRSEKLEPKMYHCIQSYTTHILVVYSFFGRGGLVGNKSEKCTRQFRKLLWVVLRFHDLPLPCLNCTVGPKGSNFPFFNDILTYPDQVIFFITLFNTLFTFFKHAVNYQYQWVKVVWQILKKNCIKPTCCTLFRVK